MNENDLVKLLEDLVQQPQEAEWLEFKHNFHTREEIGERISALSNSASILKKEFGYLVMGVKDNKSVVGTSINDTQLNDYKNSQTLRRSAQIVNIDKVWKLSKKLIRRV